MALDQRQEQGIRNAVAKAQRTKPTVLKLGTEFYAVASTSRQGEAYIVRLYTDGGTACGCRAAEQGNYCVHRAAVGLQLGTIPARFLEQPAVDSREAAPMAEPPRRGRRSLYGTAAS